MDRTRGGRLRAIGTLGVIGGLAVAVTAAGLVAAPPAAADPDNRIIHVAGATGALADAHGRGDWRGDGFVWTDFATGSSKRLPALDGYKHHEIDNTQSDLVAAYHFEYDDDNDQPVLLVDPVTGGVRRVPIPQGDWDYDGTAGDTVVLCDPDGAFSLRTVDEAGAITDRKVAGTGDGIGPVCRIMSGNGDAVGDRHGAVVLADSGPYLQHAYIDFETAALTLLPLHDHRIEVSVGATHLTWSEGGVAKMVPRADPAAAPRETPGVAPSGGLVYTVGDSLVWVDGSQLRAVPTAGGEVRTVMTTTAYPHDPAQLPGPDGSLLVYGGVTGAPWGHYRLTADPAGGPYPLATRFWTQPARISVVSGTVPAAFAVGSADWAPKWSLSKASSQWRVSVTSPGSGAEIRSFSGSGTEAGVSWDGRTTAGTIVSNGRYTWTLEADPADGWGTDLVVTGSLTVSGGAPVRHDVTGGDGFGDLLTLSGGGWLTSQFGDGDGGLSGKLGGLGWPAGTVAVPVGDTTGDRCNDVLVRWPADGQLRRYTGKCGTSGTGLTPTSAYSVVGTGWNTHEILTSPGDMNRDGFTDLIARQKSTGDVYVYPGKSNGAHGTRVRVGKGWTFYTHLVGVGDVTGDGVGDLLARHRDGTLYRYDGRGDGTLKPREVVFSGWGDSYDTIVGAGDLTGDGRPDIVSRDGEGRLFRNDGTAGGRFSNRTQIASGFAAYKALF